MKKLYAFVLSVLIVFSFSACTNSQESISATKSSATINSSFSLENVPEYSGKAYVEINDNYPYFTQSELTTKSYEYYGKLDSLGRCTACIACIGQDLQPTEKRGEIGSVKPTGWQTVKYDNVNGKYLYNRCHLIGYQLTAENANPKNLITGTPALNVDGMLPFEDMVDDYIDETNNHVLYRVTPVFKDDELVARGVLMEGYSVEDNGNGVCFNVYCYNNQPDIEIDYKTGNSRYVGTVVSTDKQTYVVNLNTRKFHKPTCEHALSISADNKKTYTGYKQNLENNGYAPCKACNP